LCYKAVQKLPQALADLEQALALSQSQNNRYIYDLGNAQLSELGR